MNLVQVLNRLNKTVNVEPSIGDETRNTAREKNKSVGLWGVREQLDLVLRKRSIVDRYLVDKPIEPELFRRGYKENLPSNPLGPARQLAPL